MNPGHLSLTDSLTFEWLNSQLSPGAYGTIAVGVILVHYVSRRFGTRVELALAARQLVGIAPTAEANAEVRAVERDCHEAQPTAVAILGTSAQSRPHLRRRRRDLPRRQGVTGESTDNVIFGFMVFGLIAKMREATRAGRKRIRLPLREIRWTIP